MRIVGDLGQRGARGADRRDDRRAIGDEIAGERDPVACVPRAADQVDVEIALDDGSRLTHLALVHADEIGSFRREPGGIGLARRDERLSSSAATSWK